MREYQLGDDEVAILSIDRQRRIAAEGRIKTRKLPKQGRVKVWIEDSASGAH